MPELQKVDAKSMAVFAMKQILEGIESGALIVVGASGKRKTIDPTEVIEDERGEIARYVPTNELAFEVRYVER